MLIEVKFAGIGLHHFLLTPCHKGSPLLVEGGFGRLLYWVPQWGSVSVNGIKPATFPSQSECVNHYTFVEN